MTEKHATPAKQLDSQKTIKVKSCCFVQYTFWANCWWIFNLCALPHLCSIYVSELENDLTWAETPNCLEAWWVLHLKNRKNVCHQTENRLIWALMKVYEPIVYAGLLSSFGFNCKFVWGLTHHRLDFRTFFSIFSSYFRISLGSLLDKSPFTLLSLSLYYFLIWADDGGPVGGK